MRAEALAGQIVLVVDGEGPSIGVGSLNQLLAASFDAGARTVAVSVARLDPGFFELASGVAGEMAQRLVNYGRRLVIVGPLPDAALASHAFSGFVLEGNRGNGPWFVASLDDLRRRLLVR